MSRQERAEAVLDEAYRLASQPLEGIEGPAKALALMCAGDANVLNEARKTVARSLAQSEDPLDKQVASLLRRAFELGSWESGFEDTKSV